MKCRKTNRNFFNVFIANNRFNIEKQIAFDYN